MIRHRFIQFVLFFVAISIQVSLIPLIGDKFFLVNALFCLLIIFSLRENRMESVVWGAILGGVSDLLLFQYIGFYGISFIVTSYILGFFAHKMVISGFFPIFLISCLSYIMVVITSHLLMFFFLGKIDITLLFVPFLFGLSLTPLGSILFDFVYKKLEKLITKK